MSKSFSKFYTQLPFDQLTFYGALMFCIGIVFQEVTKIPLTLGMSFMTFIWLIRPNHKHKWLSVFSNKLCFFLLLLYLLWLVSGFWSDDMQSFRRLIQLKISVLLALLTWSSTRLTIRQLHSILYVFLLAVFIHLSIDLAFHHFREIHVHDFSTVSKNHKHYIGLYTLFSLGISLYFSSLSTSKKQHLFWLTLILFFSFALVQISSRIHLLGAGILILFWGYKQFKSNSLSHKNIIISMLSLLILSFVALKYSSRLQFKVQETKDEISRLFSSEDNKNTNPRVYIWPAALKAIANQPFGYGLGDAQAELNVLTDQIEVQFWIDNKNTLLKDKNINSHSQYLEIILQIGFIGLILFLLAVLYGFKSKQEIYLIFLICLLVSMSTESIFERQFGLVFFSFFFPMLGQNIKTKKQKLISEN
ncbi:MAG: O-antigen ligase family protein [Flavobacteriales bacterium]